MGPYLDRFDVLLVVQGHISRIQAEEVTNFIRNIGSHSIVSSITEPDLK